MVIFIRLISHITHSFPSPSFLSAASRYNQQLQDLIRAASDTAAAAGPAVAAAGRKRAAFEASSRAANEPPAAPQVFLSCREREPVATCSASLSLSLQALQASAAGPQTTAAEHDVGMMPLDAWHFTFPLGTLI